MDNEGIGLVSVNPATRGQSKRKNAMAAQFHIDVENLTDHPSTATTHARFTGHFLRQCRTTPSGVNESYQPIEPASKYDPTCWCSIRLRTAG